MSLPSQTARTSPAGRSFVYRRRRSRRRPSPAVLAAFAAAAVVVVIVMVAIFGPPWGGPAGATAAETGLMSDNADLPVDPLVTEPLSATNRRDGLNPVPRAEETASRPTPVSRQASGQPTPERRPDPVAATTVVPESVPAPPPLERDRGMLVEALEGTNTARDLPVRPAPQAASPTRDTPPAPSATGVRSGRITTHLDAADSLIRNNDPLAARQALWDAMAIPNLDDLELKVLRDRLTALNQQLVFDGPHRAGDPLTENYTVEPGDTLSAIARKRDTATHWKLIQRVNGLSSPNRIRVGQTLKLVRGPFHAVVDKSDFRLDLYQGPTEYPERWVFVRSFTVGLGEGDSTPIGHFIVREDSKLENPGWVNPRNPAEKYTPDDPKNPIGEYWIGLDGLGDASVYAGYGIHGTVEPQSIGREMSMGCVRMNADDIALVYELLSEGESLVRIRR